MTKWLNTKDLPTDDGDYLVSWRDFDGKYASPCRAYWLEYEQAFFLIDVNVSFPVKVDIYMKVPELPKEI